MKFVAFTLAAALALIAGCSQPVTGIAHADPAVLAQIEKTRNCQTAGEALITAVRLLLQRVDGGGVGEGTIDAVLREVPITELGLSIGRQCGIELVGAEYSRILVVVNAITPATVVGRMAHQGVMSGLCRVDAASPIKLNQAARLVCAGRGG